MASNYFNLLHVLTVVSFSFAASRALAIKTPREISCLQGYGITSVLDEGYPYRDPEYFTSDYVSKADRYSIYSSVSAISGRYYSRLAPIKNWAELRKTEDNSILSAFQVPADYRVRLLSPDAEFAILTNVKTSQRSPDTILKIIATYSNRELPQLAKPRNDQYGLRFGFLSASQFFVQIHEALILYELREHEARPVRQIELPNPYFNETVLKPIFGTPFILRYGTWRAPTLIVSSQASTTVVDGSVGSGLAEFPLLRKDLEVEMFDFEMTSGLDGQLIFSDVHVASSSKLAVIAGVYQGVGRDGQSVLEKFLVFLSLQNFKVKLVLRLPNQIIDQMAMSPGDEYLAMAGPLGLHILDRRKQIVRNFAEFSERWYGTYVNHLE